MRLDQKINYNKRDQTKTRSDVLIKSYLKLIPIPSSVPKMSFMYGTELDEIH